MSLSWNTPLGCIQDNLICLLLLLDKLRNIDTTEKPKLHKIYDNEIHEEEPLVETPPKADTTSETDTEEAGNKLVLPLLRIYILQCTLETL